MSRPRKDKSTGDGLPTITIRMEKDLIDWLNFFTKAIGTDRSKYVRNIMSERKKWFDSLYAKVMMGKLLSKKDTWIPTNIYYWIKNETHRFEDEIRQKEKELRKINKELKGNGKKLAKGETIEQGFYPENRSHQLRREIQTARESLLFMEYAMQKLKNNESILPEHYECNTDISLKEKTKSTRKKK